MDFVFVLFQLSKSGLDMKMVVLPPDITTSLTVFGSTDVINTQSRHEEEVYTKCCVHDFDLKLKVACPLSFILEFNVNQETKVGFRPAFSV